MYVVRGQDDMEIRRITSHDFYGVEQLVAQVHQLHVSNRPDIYNDIVPFDREQFAGLVTDPNTIALVAEKENRLIGFCVVTLKQPSHNPLLKARKIAYMEELCVDETYRKHGVGQQLFHEACAISKNCGAEVIELMVWSFNRDACLFYESMGMTHRSSIMEKKL